MKITWIVNSINQVGGIERVVCGLSNYFFRELKLDVEIISLATNESRLFFPIDENIPIHHYNLNWSDLSRLDCINNIRNIISKLDSNFIITCHPTISNAVIINKKVYKGKIIVTEHSMYKQYTIKRRVINTLLFRFADAFLVLNECDKKFYKKMGCKPAILPNAIFNCATERSTLDKKILLSIGRLEPVKGYERLISAFAIASKDYPDWKLCICGDGTEKDKLIEIATELCIKDKVILPGTVKDVETYLSEASVFAISSFLEGFSLVLIDALSYGLPIISFELPSVYEICGTDGAIVVPQNDIVGYAKGLSKLFSSLEVRKYYGLKSYECSNEYKISTVGKMWLKLFEKMSS